jgi:hypothetical protein
MLTERQRAILLAVARHYILTAAQVRRLVFRPEQDPDGRITRRLLSALYAKKLINKTHCEVVNPLHGLTCPVYYPSRLGCELLAVSTGDPSHHLVPTQHPQWQNLRHFAILSDLRILLDAAIAGQQDVIMPNFFNEFDVVNKDAAEPSSRYRLYTLIEQAPRRLCCVPDAAFQLTASGAARAFYIELETGSNPPRKSAAEKSPGYSALAAQSLHRRHFPDARDFRVLCIAPDAPWRDALRAAFRGKDGARWWKFAALTELKPEVVLHTPLFYAAEDGQPSPLVLGGKQ